MVNQGYDKVGKSWITNYGDCAEVHSHCWRWLW